MELLLLNCSWLWLIQNQPAAANPAWHTLNKKWSERDDNGERKGIWFVPTDRQIDLKSEIVENLSYCLCKSVVCTSQKEQHII